ncbi:Uncharacterized protein TCM_046263 [Theobroma cacao]|uniref:RNase H type-1 domain-containing protein n=1 Tax=Theobroma cacao TaxID=3641 RepID=S1RW95_THECC|nr:Uncharacterized protein TCM_046263 [Theobroma cacao]
MYRNNMAFSVILRTIWLHRNNMIFQGKVWDPSPVFELAESRVSQWAKAKWPAMCSSSVYLPCDPTCVSVLKEKLSAKSFCVWVRPPVGSLKFNVDGAAKDCPGLVGLGGMLRDCSRNVKLLFSKSLGIDDSNLSEIMTMKDAFVFFFATFSWASSHSLIIELNSMSAVKWCNNLEIAS